MPRNDDGEFELVLGNRQLLSVFFIVVVLLGVFFTMGYIVGKNSAPVIADAQRKTDKPLSVDSPIVTETAPPPVSEAPALRETAPQLPADVPTPPSEPKKEAVPVPAPKAEKTEKKKAPDAAKKSKSAPNEQPTSGQSYLQLAATSKREADVMVDVLRQKGFKAIAAEIPEKPGIFRVLVGPVPEGGRNAVRSDLQKSGFPGNAAVPRTF